MGKLTFRRRVRVVTTLKRNYFMASLPICGGTLFLLGSFCFIPDLGRDVITVGALCFLVGSICYWAAPLLDFWELTHNHDNLLEPPPDSGLVLTPSDSRRMAAFYEHLYKAHLLRIQCANCLVYMLGGAFFVGGSVLFFPAMEELIYHGGWLYITGCVMTLAGALLAMFTAFEMQKTAMPMRFTNPPHCVYMPNWSDEGATIASCALYVIGNLAYIVGSICFFPKVIEQFGVIIEWTAVVLFILGSVFFLIGAVIDLLLMARSSVLVRPSFAPQLRELNKGLRQPKSRSAGRRYGQMSDDVDVATHPQEVELAEASRAPAALEPMAASDNAASTTATSCSGRERWSHTERRAVHERSVDRSA